MLGALECHLSGATLTQKACCIQSLQVFTVGHLLPCSAQIGKAYRSRKEAKHTALRFFCLCMSFVSSSTFLHSVKCLSPPLM